LGITKGDGFACQHRVAAFQRHAKAFSFLLGSRPIFQGVDHPDPIDFLAGAGEQRGLAFKVRQPDIQVGTAKVTA
jgi:hypothetical protein